MQQLEGDIASVLEVLGSRRDDLRHGGGETWVGRFETLGCIPQLTENGMIRWRGGGFGAIEKLIDISS